MRGILRVAGWTWATLANVAYNLYPAALLYSLGIVALARRYGKRLTFWTSLLANPYAWLALVFAAGGILRPKRRHEPGADHRKCKPGPPCTWGGALA